MAAIAAAFEAGFRRVKLKIRPGWALEMLRSVRQEFPGETFHIDCEGALSLNYMEMLYRFDDFALEMVEQPLAAEDLVAHAMLQESLRTPICLDESIASPLHAEMALDLKSCRHVNLKAGRVGGLTAALTILEACQAAEVIAGAAPRPKARSAPGPTWPWPPARVPHTRPISFPRKANWPRTWPSRCTRSAMRATARRKSHWPRSRGWGSFPMLRCWRIRHAEGGTEFVRKLPRSIACRALGTPKVLLTATRSVTLDSEDRAMAVFTEHAEHRQRRRVPAFPCRRRLAGPGDAALPARLRRMPQNAGGRRTGKAAGGRKGQEEERKGKRAVRGPQAGRDALGQGFCRVVQAGPLDQPGLARREGQSRRLSGRTANGDRRSAATTRCRWLAVPYEMTNQRPAALAKEQPKSLESFTWIPPLQDASRGEFQAGGRRRRPGGDRAEHAAACACRRIAITSSSSRKAAGRYEYLDKKLASIHLHRPTADADAGPKYYEVVSMPASRRPSLPANALYWTSIAYLLWDDFDPAQWDVDQQQALIDWLHWGGQIIVSGPDALEQLRNSFLRPYLPASVEKSRSFAAQDLAELQYWAGEVGLPPKPVKPWPGADLKKDPQAKYLPYTGDLLIERQVGRGRIVVSAFRLTGPELTGWAGFDCFFNACLLRRPARMFPTDAGSEDVRFRWVDGKANSPRLDAAKMTAVRYFVRDTGVEFDDYAADIVAAQKAAERLAVSTA